MKKNLITFLVVITAVFFVHQYEHAGPYNAVLRQEKISPDLILENLKKWRYHDYVWFEWVPDAVTTVFKRLGIGGWTETGHRACAEGCAYWTEKWTDGFYSVDMEMEKISLDGGPEVPFTFPRYLDVEIWGNIRSQLKKKGGLPEVGNRVAICGPLRIDRPYHVYTIQPDNADEVKNTGLCEASPKDEKSAVHFISENSCEKIASSSLFKQIAYLDALAVDHPSDEAKLLIEKMVSCVSPKVLEALATSGDVYERLVRAVPEIRQKLPPVQQSPKMREGNPVRNTIADLIEHWTH
ncbi:MAG: hypothetical protein U1F57_10870 [bacterium]